MFKSACRGVIASLIPWLCSIALAAEWVEVSPAELERMQQDANILVLDVRTPAEYAAGHVPGAINIPHESIAAQLELLQRHRDQPVVLYCQSGRRATLAAEVLERAGFSGLKHLTGDMPGWREAGLPTAVSSSEPGA